MIQVFFARPQGRGKKKWDAADRIRTCVSTKLVGPEPTPFDRSGTAAMKDWFFCPFINLHHGRLRAENERRALQRCDGRASIVRPQCGAQRKRRACSTVRGA